MTMRTILSILAGGLSAGFLLSADEARYIGWSWNQSNRFCTTPLGWATLLAFVAMILLFGLAATVRLLFKKKNVA
jgi:hypothetical protein